MGWRGTGCNFCKTALIWAVISSILIAAAPWIHADDEPEITSTSIQEDTSGRTAVNLYFATEYGCYLTAEKRGISRGESPLQFASAIVSALIEGPRRGNRLPTLPKNATVKAVFITPSGEAFLHVDRTFTENPNGSIISETIALYSVVNSLVLNVPEIDAVQILPEGETVETFSGHLDIRRPLTANLLLIR